MNPLDFVIVTILYCFGDICKGQRVFISQDETKWNEFRCTLAKPKVVCGDDGSCIVKDGFEFLTNVDNQEYGFWIGYAKTWISYAYVGCFQLNGEAEYSVSTLGECRRTTRCKTFGIQKSTAGLRCKCASDNAPRKKSCKEECIETDQYPCGDTAKNNIFSVYTVENVPLSNNSQDIHRNCLLFYYHYSPENYYHWEKCNIVQYPALLCSNKYFSVRWSCDREIERLSYSEMSEEKLKYCFRMLSIVREQATLTTTHQEYSITLQDKDIGKISARKSAPGSKVMCTYPTRKC